jgi:cell wall-associated NlpC family hydrolase
VKARHARVVRRERRVVRVAVKQLGVPYVWGGESRSGFDCSGLVRYVYRRVGISLPHYTVSQFERGSPVALRHLKPGDLLFFYGLGHVGLYIGHGLLVHAPHSGTRVSVARLASYAGRVSGARRLIH